jgi:4'-phosphopantetheinyl transferase
MKTTDANVSPLPPARGDGFAPSRLRALEAPDKSGAPSGVTAGAGSIIELALWTVARPAGDSYAIEHCRPLLDPSEQERAGRFMHDRDRWAFATAHALLRSMLARLHGRAPLAWEFVASSHGKPELAVADPERTIRFNISHTRDLVACLVTKSAVPAETLVGVDVETRERASDLDRLAERFFHPAEVAELRALPADQRPPAFFRLWTLKEAVVKALGQGISLGFDSFRCRSDPVGLEAPALPFGPPEAWHLAVEPAGSLHTLAAAIRRPPEFAIQVERRDFISSPW